MSSTSPKDALPFAPSPPNAPYPVLPSYEDVTTKKDQRKLPSYRQTQIRFHPYRRPVPELTDGTGTDRYYNTIYDEERIDVIPPPALPHGPPPARALVAGPLLDPRLQPDGIFYDIYGPPNALFYAHGYPHMRGIGGEDFDQRYAAVAEVIMQEFLAGLARANHMRAR